MSRRESRSQLTKLERAAALLRDSTGLSLIEIMIASGLALALALGLSTMLVGMDKNQRTITDRTEQRNYATLLKAYVQNPAVLSTSAAQNPTTSN